MSDVPPLEPLAEVIAEHYDLGEIGEPRLLPRAHQRRHRKAVVSTSRGDYLAKTYVRDPYVLDDLRFQHRLSDHLAAHGVPVAPVEAAKDGRRYVEADTWALELQRYVRGEPMRVTSATLSVAGAVLGRFHEVCRGLPRPRRGELWRFSIVPRRAFGGLYESASQAGDPAVASANCDRIGLFLHRASEALSPESRERFELGLIHGDWHGGNLIFRGEALQAVVDLEFAGEGCYLEDLAYSASNLCVRTTADPARLESRMRTLLREYQSYRPLPYYERVALYYAIGVKHVATVSYQLAQLGGVVAGKDAFQWMETLAAQCDWLEGQAREAGPARGK